jgi:nucleotide-binding universal stress UspA family protein
MQPFRTILHPTDFSEHSEAAIRAAGALARDEGARLIVLHAAPMATVYGGTFPGVPTDTGIYRHALEERLRQIRIPGPEAEDRPRSGSPAVAGEGPLRGGGTPGPEVLVEHRLREGDAAEEILQVADDVGADLIVMGTHGRTGLGRLLMGSVAEAVLRRASCPVLTVRAALPGRTAPSEVAAPATAIP